jgi:hypothetical protein
MLRWELSKEEIERVESRDLWAYSPFFIERMGLVIGEG